jgi:hypothetical protein
MNERAASRAVSKSATPKNCAASCGVFTSRKSGINANTNYTEESRMTWNKTEWKENRAPIKQARI